METIAPTGPVYQAGTSFRNPLAMAAGLAVLDALSDPNVYARLAELTERLIVGAREAAARHGIPFTTNNVCGMFGFFFTGAERVTRFAEVQQCDLERFRHFFHGMLDRGVYLAPSAFEAGFLSITHDEGVIDETLAAMDATFASMAWKKIQEHFGNEQDLRRLRPRQRTRGHRIRGRRRLLFDNDIAKGQMTLVEVERQRELMMALGTFEPRRGSGGSAANTLIGLAGMGGRAYYSCKVASDEIGQFFVRDLIAAGVDTNADQHHGDGDSGRCACPAHSGR